MPVTPKQLADEIVRQAKVFAHLKEIAPNSKWDDPRTPAWEKELNDLLVTTMKEDGWEPGQAYCIAFDWAVVILAMRRLNVDKRLINRFKKAICPHVMTSYRAFKELGLVKDKPRHGALMLMNRIGSDSGHAAIVDNSAGSNMLTYVNTVEGNTSAEVTGDERERNGDGIYERVRDPRQNGRLKTVGYIWPEALLAA